MGCFSGRLMSAASDQKLFCRLCSPFCCSFDEFVEEKVIPRPAPPPSWLLPLCWFSFRTQSPYPGAFSGQNPGLPTRDWLGAPSCARKQGKCMQPSCLNDYGGSGAMWFRCWEDWTNKKEMRELSSQITRYLFQNLFIIEICKTNGFLARNGSIFFLVSAERETQFV